MGTRMRVAAALGTALVTAGCGVAQAERPGGPVDVSVLRTATYEFRPAESLEALATRETVVVTGSVAGFARGHDVLAWNSEAGYHDVRESHAVLRVSVDQVYKGEDQVRDGQVYVSLYRGAEALTESGRPDRPEGAGPTVVPVDAFRAAIPAGTRVAILASPLQIGSEPGERPVGLHNGYPAGATLLSSGVQGLLLEDGASGSVLGGVTELREDLPGWRELDTFADVEDRLDALPRQ